MHRQKLKWLLLICLTISFICLLNIGTCIAAVTQQTGFYDTQYASLTNDDCKNCHGADLVDRHHGTIRAVNSQCSYCHISSNGQLEVNRDCKYCHASAPHHQTTIAQSGTCTACHSSQVVSSIKYDVGSYDPMKLPDPTKCRNCHLGDSSLLPPVGESRDLHHAVGMDCTTCHNSDKSLSIRLCEQCHQPKELHTIHRNKCGWCHSMIPDTQLPTPIPMPQIASLSDMSGRPGEVVTLTGSAFSDTQGTVRFGINNVEVQSWADQSIVIIVPNLAPGNYEVSVLNNNGVSNIKVYTIVPDLISEQPSSFGFPDRLYTDLTESDCRNCHGTTEDRHHAARKAVLGNCAACHQSSGDTVIVTRNCKICHVKGPHHSTGAAMTGLCTACHSGKIVSDFKSVAQPISLPGTLTPTTASCSNCHKTPTNKDTHYTTGLDCAMCHDSMAISPIRTCENCHSVGTIHNVTSHLRPENCIGCHNGTPDQLPLLSVVAPQITKLDPVSGGPGLTLNVYADSLGGMPDKCKVYFNNTVVPLVDWGDGYLTIRVPELPIGNYRVLVQTPAGKSNTMVFTVTNPGSMKGKVTDTNGKALAKARVTIGTKEAYTDATGNYAINGIAEGTYSAQASLTGWAVNAKTVNIINNVSTKVNFTLSKGTQRQTGTLIKSTGGTNKGSGKR